MTSDQSWSPAPLRFYDGPYSAPPTEGPPRPPEWLVGALPSIARVLQTPEPGRIPVRRDTSFRWDESLAHWGGRMSHWPEWTQEDTALIAKALTPEVVEAVEQLIGRWEWAWPYVAAQVLPVQAPAFVARLTDSCVSEPRFKRKRDAFRSAWLEVALHEGLFEHFRTFHRWPAPRGQVCAVCGRAFAPESLSPWMRQYGTPRYCAVCCCRARNGCVVDSPEAVKDAVRDAFAGLGFVPAQGCATGADLNSLDGSARDLAMAGLICIPMVAEAASLLGIKAKAGRWLAVLQMAGVVGEAWRPARGTLCFAQDGHACRSLGERSVDDFMSRFGIAHEPEPLWPTHPTLNPDGKWRADWRLSDGTLVEYVGLMETETYRDKIERKLRLAAEANLRILIIAPEDLPRLTARFSSWLRAGT